MIDEQYVQLPNQEDTKSLAYKEATRVVRRQPYLGRAIVPTIQKFAEVGIVGHRLESLLDVISTQNLGNHMATKFFLEALLDATTQDELMSLGTGVKQYETFLERLGRIVELRIDFLEAGYKVSHRVSFELYDNLGERALLLAERINERFTNKGEYLRPSEVVKLLCELEKGSRRVGHSIEALLDQEFIERDETDASVLVRQQLRSLLKK